MARFERVLTAALVVLAIAATANVVYVMVSNGYIAHAFTAPVVWY